MKVLPFMLFVFFLFFVIAFAFIFISVKAKRAKRTRKNRGYSDLGVRPMKADKAILKNTRHDNSSDSFK